MPPREDEVAAVFAEEHHVDKPRAYCPVCHIFEPGTHGPRCAGIGEGEIVGYGPTDRWLERN